MKESVKAKGQEGGDGTEADKEERMEKKSTK